MSDTSTEVIGSYVDDLPDLAHGSESWIDFNEEEEPVIYATNETEHNGEHDSDRGIADRIPYEVFSLKTSDRDSNVTFPADFHCHRCRRRIIPRIHVYFTTCESQAFPKSKLQSAVWALPLLKQNPDDSLAKVQQYEGGETFTVGSPLPRDNKKKGQGYMLHCDGCDNIIGIAYKDMEDTDRAPEKGWRGKFRYTERRGRDDTTHVQRLVLSGCSREDLDAYYEQAGWIHARQPSI